MSHPLYNPTSLSDDEIYKKMGDILKRMNFARQTGDSYAVHQLQLMYDDLEMAYSERQILKDAEANSNPIVLETDPDLRKKNEQEQAAKSGHSGKVFGGKGIRPPGRPQDR